MAVDNLENILLVDRLLELNANSARGKIRSHVLDPTPARQRNKFLIFLLTTSVCPSFEDYKH